MPTTKEQLVWDEWNSARVKDGLVGDRLGLCEEAVREINALNLPSQSALLDLGCGAGWTGERLHQHFDYLGLDLSEAALTAARQRLPNTRFMLADFLTWNSPNEAYSAILCVDSIAVMRDQDAVIEKMAQLLKPGGWLVITTVNPFCYSRMGQIGPPKEGQARNWLTKNALHALLERHGFVIEKSRSILPAGNKGVLRLINSWKLNRIAGTVIGKNRIRAAKEAVGLGQFRVVVAQLGRLDG
jgi:2-polyprenyl-3-methyl-5-hydroxy-6-metoxy-1,4-benzoquinol methylase